MENIDEGLTVPATMGADKSAENSPNAPKCICPDCLSKLKGRDFNEKRLHWASIVRALDNLNIKKSILDK